MINFPSVGRKTLLQMISRQFPEDYDHAGILLNIDTKAETILSYELLLKRIFQRKQQLLGKKGIRSSDRVVLASDNAETLRKVLRCKVCLENQVAVFLEPCQHVCTCGPCAALLDLCPVCRQPIQERREIFLS